MPAQVEIESAGSHVFDLDHIRREGGVDLVQRWLSAAGFRQDQHWRVQVQKKILCNAETPPARVVDTPKKWAVYVKIKPGDNNTCHYCSLLMPDGMQGEVVYEALRQAEETLDRNWKHTAAPAHWAAPPRRAQEDAEADRNGSGHAAAAAPVLTHGFLKDEENVRLTLFAIHEVGALGFIRDQAHFMELVCQRLGWTDLNRHQSGGVFAHLGRRGYVMRVLRGSKPVGYELTPEGQALIHDLVNAAPAVPELTPPRPALPDPARLIRAFGPLARQFAQAEVRLEELAAREAVLAGELETIRREREEICRLLADEEHQSLVWKLVRGQSAEPPNGDHATPPGPGAGTTAERAGPSA